MRILLFTIVLLVTSCALAQEVTAFKFAYKKDSIQANMIDYSRFGVIHHFISFVKGDDNYNEMIKTHSNCLANKSRIYHTLYFVVLVPDQIESKDEINEFVTATIQSIALYTRTQPAHRYLSFGDFVLNPYDLAGGKYLYDSRLFFYALPDNTSWCKIVNRNAMSDLHRRQSVQDMSDKRRKRYIKRERRQQQRALNNVQNN